MKEGNELRAIECDFDVSKTKVNNIAAWPLLRQTIYFGIINHKLKFNNKLRTRNLIQLLKNFAYGWKNLFRLKKFDYLFFNNADKRTCKVNNKYYDVFFDSWADELGQKDSLFIEWAIQRHFPEELTYSKNVISDVFVKFGVLLCSLFTTISIEEVKEIEKIKNEYNLDFNTKKHLKNKFSEIVFYRFLFKWISPKSIFLISSFTKVSLVVAAHMENIKVIEVQHGYIGNNHQFYNAYTRFGYEYYPDILIAFGNQEKKHLPPTFIFQKEQITPVGSFYLEDVKNNYINDYLRELQNKYKYLFCVTLQTVKEVDLLNWVSKQAMAHEDWLFVLKPRNIDHLKYNDYLLANNLILLPEFNIYQVLKYSTYNITIYSTTAVEASYFDVKTLFYNIDGLSEKYYGGDNLFATYINPEKDIAEEDLELDSINFLNYFVSNYKENIKNACI